MGQIAVTCPKCGFVLQIQDSGLLGRKGRCPKCRDKFILIETETPASSADDVLLEKSMPTIIAPIDADLAESAARVESTPAAAKTPAATKTPVAPKTPAAKPRASAASAPEKQSPLWKADYQRGLGSQRPTLSARWILPDVLAVSTITVIGMGAIIGASIAKFVIAWWPEAISDLRVVLRAETILALAAALGGVIAACCLIRRHDPDRLQSDSRPDDRVDE